MTEASPIFDAQLEVACQCTLGEGIMWDDRMQLLHWVDIDEAKVHSYDPVTRAHAVAVYPETEYVTALAPRQDEPGFIAAFAASIVLIDPAAPSPTATAQTNRLTPSLPTPTPSTSRATVSAPLAPADVAARNVRFNDGAADPAGRFVVGSMTLPEVRDGTDRGQLFSVTGGGTAEKVLFEGVGTSNGIDWSPDGKTMYYIDSGHPHVWAFDYDVATGTPSNKRAFADLPPGINGRATVGAFDGLVVDGVGNVWVARWADERVLCYSPRGEIVVQVRTPGAKSPTIPCFGGKDLSTLYIATASANLAGEGEIQARYPRSGDVFSIECGEGSGVGRVLGAGWKGRVRHRFAM